MEEQVGRYKIKGQLGRGAMGVVYLADDPLLNRQAAIKTVDLGGDPEQAEFNRTRLLRDARAAAGLSHPNIVGVFDVVEERDAAYLVMEYIPGETLAAVLNRTAIPDAAFTMRILRDMAAALDYTHARGIIHRDIKPANVMIDTSQAAKVMDFGIARIADTRTSTPTGMVMGTIEYMSPEQVKGEPVDGRSDQFALAAVAFRMLTGTTVFGQHSLATLAYKIVHETPPLVRMHNAGLPAAVDAVVSKAMSKSPADRYATCTDFVNALAAALSTPDRQAATIPLPQPSVPIPSVAMPPPPAPKSAKGAILGIAAVLVLGAAGVAVWRPWETPVPSSPAPAIPTSQAATEPTVSPVNSPQPPAVVKPQPSAPRPVPTTTPAAPKPDLSPAVAGSAAEDAAESAPAEPVPPQIPQAVVDAHAQGTKLLAANRLDDAVAAFSRAIALRPDWPTSYFDRGEAYQRLNNFQAAIRDYTQFLEMRPQVPNAHTNRGQCYVRLKDDDRALEDFNAAITLKTEAPVALYGRGMIHMRRGGYRAALADFDASIRFNPKGALAYTARGNAKQKLGDEPGAQADFRKARELAGK